MPSWTGGTFTPDAGTITDQQIASGASITVDKQQHAYKPRSDFGLKIGDTPVTVEKIVHVASGTGTVRSFSALLNATGSASSMTFDLKKNGASILSSPVLITNANSNRQILTGTIASPALVAGDVLSIALTVSTSTGAQGPFAWAGLSETVGP